MKRKIETLKIYFPMDSCETQILCWLSPTILQNDKIHQFSLRSINQWKMKWKSFDVAFALILNPLFSVRSIPNFSTFKFTIKRPTSPQNSKKTFFLFVHIKKWPGNEDVDWKINFN